MKSGRQPQGYTLVEVMIFLAVTSMIFIAAMVTINGQQKKTQFGQAMRDINSQLQGVINEVYSGFYPSFNNIHCTAPGGGGQLQFSLVSNTNQGTNDQCVFIGKAIQFDTQGTNQTGFNVFTIAGRRYQDGTKLQVTSLAQATPTAVYSGGGSVDLTQKNSLKFGLQIYRARVKGTSTDVSTFGFVSSFGRYNPATNDLISGAQTLDLAATSGSGIVLGGAGRDEASGATDASSMTPAVAANGIVLCFVDDYSQQKGAIIIGDNNSRLSTSLILDNIQNVPEC